MKVLKATVFAISVVGAVASLAVFIAASVAAHFLPAFLALLTAFLIMTAIAVWNK